jgi:hypothetical protein
LAAKLFRSHAKISQAVTRAAGFRSLIESRNRESAAIVPNLADNLVMDYFEAEINRTAVRVAHRIIDAFFEDQKYLSPLLWIQSDYLSIRWRVELPDNALGTQQI